MRHSHPRRHRHRRQRRRSRHGRCRDRRRPHRRGGRRCREPPRRARHRCRRARGRAGLHRHQDPFRLHPAAQPAGREQDPPGRDHRGDRPLRLLGRARAARKGGHAARLSLGERAVDRLPRDQLRRLSRHVSGDLDQCRRAGRPQHAAPHGDGAGGAPGERGRAGRHGGAAGRGAGRRRARAFHRAFHAARPLCPDRGDNRAGPHPAPPRRRLFHPSAR